MTLQENGIAYFQQKVEEFSKPSEQEEDTKKSIDEAIQFVRELQAKKETTHVVKFAGQKIECVVCFLRDVVELREVKRVHSHSITLYNLWNLKNPLALLTSPLMIGTSLKIKKESKKRWRKRRRMGRRYCF